MSRIAHGPELIATALLLTAAVLLWAWPRSKSRFAHESDLVRLISDKSRFNCCLRRETDTPGVDSVFVSDRPLSELDAARLSRTGEDDSAWRGIFWVSRCDGADARPELWGEKCLRLGDLWVYGDLDYARKILTLAEEGK